ncbi:PREDICTED: uncharacterized protein LOC106741702 [Dinoponera quadriceps]|uniref:Uncharacterized protein LOC106741702 n=1 Tax=Dinoponera quadriceps TaxID=609295 RepID=A0A6P3WTH5_DINQU|nr:PREDICTED: uncharacterized protein LOC106741702 [Dinoponera quadriceps]
MVAKKKLEDSFLHNKRRVKIRQWDSSNMAKAIAAVRKHEMGWLKASKTFQVPQKTLRRLADEKYGTPEEAATCKLGRPPVFSPELEKELLRYCLTMETTFHGLTRKNLRRLALQLAIKNNIKHPFNDIMAGKSWLRSFLKRHPELCGQTISYSKPIETSFAKKEGFTKNIVDNFFNLLDATFNEYNYPPDRIYSVDEIGLRIIQSKVPQVIGIKGKRQIDVVSSAERRSLTTIICSMNATGHFVPPMVIFPGKTMSHLLMRGAPAGSIGVAHPSGWVQTNLFTQWFEHFISKTKPTKEDPVLLLLDGHFNHTKNLKLIDLARENFIKIISFPPYTTHMLQPLEKTFMEALKTYYSEEIGLWMHSAGKPATGLYPLNRGVFSDCDFIAAQADAGVQDVSSISDNVSLPATPLIGIASLVPVPSVEPQSTTAIPSVGLQLSTSGGTNAFDIASVLEKRRKISTGRTAESNIITTLSYKAELIATTEKKEEREGRRGRGIKYELKQPAGSKGQSNKVKARPVKKLNSEKTDDDSSSVEDLVSSLSASDDAACIFCDQFHSQDNKRLEKWVQCLSCEEWAHTECAGADRDIYICYYCQ